MKQNIKKMGWNVVAWTLLCGFVLAVAPVFAQAPTSTILGVVKDSTGGTVAGASVTVTNADTGLKRTATTGDDGAYRFAALAVGNYQLQVTKDGFQTAQRKGITLQVAQEASIDFTLQVGSTGQTVVVTEEAPLVQTTSSTVGGLVTEEQVTDLPLNGRNLVDLTLMQAGITQTTVIPALTMGSGFMTGVTLSANGAPIHSNNYSLDGANMLSTMGLNASSMLGTTLGVDGVKEYKVVTNLPDAEYGLAMGGNTVIVSKGGTNSWHGDAFDYLRNGSLDARNYFDALDKLNFNGAGTDKSFDYPGKRIPPFHRNNFGGSVGGPIKKDKLFFYAVYEALRQTWGQTITTKTLPAACFDAITHVVTDIALTSQACTGVTGGIPVANLNPAVKYALETPNIIPGYTGLFPYPDVNINPDGSPQNGATFNYSFPFIQPSKEDYGQIRVQAPRSLPVRWAALLHDAGKVTTRSVDAAGEVHFFGHETVSAAIVDEAARRFRFDRALHQRVRTLVLLHQRPALYDGGWTDGAVRRLIRDAGEALPDLLDLSRADVTSHRPGIREGVLARLADLQTRAAGLIEKDGQAPLLPKGIGQAIMAHLGIEAGPRVGELRSRLEQAVLDGELPRDGSPQEYLGYLDRILA